ncbi:MAG TPA: aminopeptidase [Gaiellaceae bacterium]
MNDPRFDRLAELVLAHSLELQGGQVLRIEASAAATPLVLALHREAIRRGAHAYVDLELEGLQEILVAEGSDQQLDFVSPVEQRELERVDAVITIWSESNTRSFSRLDPERHRRLIAASRRLAIIRRDRMARGDLRWCGTLSPTNAHAQDAEMSLGEYEDFVFRACHVLDGDPIGHWRSLAAELGARAETLGSVQELRIVGQDTDLTVAVRGRTWRAAHGLQNMPDGEVYTSPIETGVEGTIRFGFPAVFEGREIKDITLRFAEGRVVAAEAADGQSYLEALLELDEGARVAGEIAFGLNYEIDRFTRNILFDEKIGGTMHLALGMGFENLGGLNRSALHLDLICDLRREGEVYADGELVWRAGSFLHEPHSAPAPEHVG